MLNAMRIGWRAASNAAIQARINQITSSAWFKCMLNPTKVYYDASMLLSSPVSKEAIVYLKEKINEINSVDVITLLNLYKHFQGVDPKFLNQLKDKADNDILNGKFTFDSLGAILQFVDLIEDDSTVNRILFLKCFHKFVLSGLHTISDEDLIEYAKKTITLDDSKEICEDALKKGYSLLTQGKLSKESQESLLLLALNMELIENGSSIHARSNTTCTAIIKLLLEPLIEQLKWKEFVPKYAIAFSLPVCSNMIYEEINKHLQIFLSFVDESLRKSDYALILKILKAVEKSQDPCKILPYITTIETILGNVLLNNQLIPTNIPKVVECIYNITKINNKWGISNQPSTIKLFEKFIAPVSIDLAAKEEEKIKETYDILATSINCMALIDWQKEVKIQPDFIKAVLLHIFSFIKESSTEYSITIQPTEHEITDDSFTRVVYGKKPYSISKDAIKVSMFDNDVILKSGLISNDVTLCNNIPKLIQYMTILFNCIKLNTGRKEVIVNEIVKLLENFFSTNNDILLIKYCVLSSLEFAEGLYYMLSFIDKYNEYFTKYHYSFHDAALIGHLLSFVNIENDVQEQLTATLKEIYKSTQKFVPPTNLLEIPTFMQIAKKLKQIHISEHEQSVLNALKQKYNVIYGAIVFPFVFEAMLISKTAGKPNLVYTKVV